jgi:hypothetical protein
MSRIATLGFTQKGATDINAEKLNRVGAVLRSQLAASSVNGFKITD